jgi:hypothetical protein
VPPDTSPMLRDQRQAGSVGNRCAYLDQQSGCWCQRFKLSFPRRNEFRWLVSKSVLRVPANPLELLGLDR